MEFNQLLALLEDIPVFESSLLLAGNVRPENIRLQLARWSSTGKIIQLRRGLYAVAEPYRKIRPHPFMIANLMQHASYVSLQSALAFHGLIPETVQVMLSITSGRPRRWETPLGVFEFRHVRRELLCGYRMTGLERSRPAPQALVATPAKALLDLVYLQPGGDLPTYLQELRLQNLDRLDLEELRLQAGGFNSPKLRRAVHVIARLAQDEAEGYRPL
jgi:predicted transcriptional regulator of viral defense system